MRYEVKRLDKGLSGEVVEVWAGDYMNAQASLDDGFYLRINTTTYSSSYRGRLWKPDLKVGKEDGATFSTLVQRIERLAGGNVPFPGLHSKINLSPFKFKDYVEKTGLCEEIGDITVRINTENLDGALGPYAVDYLEKKRKFRGVRIPFAEDHLKRKIFHPTKFWDEFLATYTKVKTLEDDWKITDKYGKLSDKVDKILGVASAVLVNTDRLKGLSIEYMSKNLDDVYEFFRLLTTGKFPAANEVEEEVEEESKTPITDPWDVDIPEIKEGLR